MDFGNEKFEASILNTGEMVHNMEEFVNIADKYFYSDRMESRT